MATDLVPRAVLSPPETARKRVALVVAAASGAAALAGLWLRVDDGPSYRLVLAVTSAIFAFLAIDIAMSAKTAVEAAGRAWGLSIVFGSASTLIPSLILGMHDRPPMAVIIVPFGAVFGAFVGFAYGAVLAIVAAATFNRVASGTHDGADRAVRVACVWTILPAALIALVVFGHDAQVVLGEWSSDRERALHAMAMPLGMLALGIATQVALGSYLLATRRLARRRKWLDHVASGVDPLWTVRAMNSYDELGTVPRLGHTGMVLERKNEHAIYRATAAGEIIAVI